MPASKRSPAKPVTPPNAHDPAEDEIGIVGENDKPDPDRFQAIPMSRLNELLADWDDAARD